MYGLRLVVAVALMIFTAPTHAVIINLDNRIIYVGIPIDVTELDASLSYSAQTGVSIGGGYEAWNTWEGNVGGCDGAGANCATDWVCRFLIVLTWIRNPLRNVHASAALALDRASGNG